MITGFNILGVEGHIDSSNALLKQRFPRLNVNLEKVETSGDKLNVGYSFDADYLDGEGKDAERAFGQVDAYDDVLARLDRL